MQLREPRESWESLAGAPASAPPLRVLHLLGSLEQGGTERLVLLLAREQLRLGCQVEVAVLRGEGPMAAEFRAAGLPLFSLGLRRKLAPLVLSRLRRAFRRGHYHIVHTHLDLADLYGPLAAWGMSGTRVLSTRHNTDPWRTRRSWKRWPFLVWERAAHRRADATIAVSAAVRDFLVAGEGLDPSRFVIIANGIDLAPYRQSLPRRQAQAIIARRLGLVPGEAAAPGGRQGERAVAGFIGRLAQQKGVDLLLQALPLVTADLDLVVVGDGPEAEALQALASRLDNHRVFFAGHQDAVHSWMFSFDQFVFPSRWEGFGLAAVEAMAAGLPVVAADTDGLREVVVDGITGLLVSPGKPAALAAAMGRLAANRELAVRLGAAGRQRAFESFGAQRMGREVVDLYHRLLVKTTEETG